MGKSSAMAEAPRIVPLSAVDEDDILELVRIGLGDGSAPRSRELWGWKHREGPFGPSPGLAAVVGNQVVALRVFSRWRFRGAGGEHSAVRAVDTATHPDWRRRGLFRRLTTELVEAVAAEGTPFVFNTPNRVSFEGYRALGWRSAGRVPLAVRPIGGRVLLPRKPSAAAPAMTDPWRPVEELLTEPHLAAFLTHLWHDEPRLRTPRDATYLEWRYAKVPGIDYRATWDLEPGAGAALIARPRLRAGRPEVALAEVLIRPGRESTRKAVSLLRRTIATAAADGAQYLVATPSRQTMERTVLRRAGFLVVPGAGPRLAVRCLAPGSDLPQRLTSHSWRWSLGDLELF